MALIVAFVVTVVAAPLAALVRTRLGMVDRPGLLKVQTHPVPYLGGFALFAGLVGPVAIEASSAGKDDGRKLSAGDPNREFPDRSKTRPEERRLERGGTRLVSYQSVRDRDRARVGRTCSRNAEMLEASPPEILDRQEEARLDDLDGRARGSVHHRLSGMNRTRVPGSTSPGLVTPTTGLISRFASCSRAARSVSS